jgi:hypothetical protein
MRFLLGAMLASFGLAGVALLWWATQMLRQYLRRRRHLARSQGLIIRVHQQRVQFTTPRMRSTTANYPIIEFQTPANQTITFRSAIGDLGRSSRYRPGQPVAVRYDPEGVLPPMLDTWAAGWWGPLAMAAGGCAFLGGAALIILAQAGYTPWAGGCRLFVRSRRSAQPTAQPTAWPG